MYTEEEKMTAQALVSNPAFLALLKKVFTEVEDKIDDIVVDNRTDKQLGEIVRADSMAERKIKMRYSKLMSLGAKLDGKSNRVKA